MNFWFLSFPRKSNALQLLNNAKYIVNMKVCIAINSTCMTTLTQVNGYQVNPVPTEQRVQYSLDAPYF